MAASKPTAPHTRASARDVASSGTAVRERVRELSVGAFRDRKLSLREHGRQSILRGQLS